MDESKKLVLKRDPFGFFNIVWSSGGQVPTELTGSWNNHIKALDAIAQYWHKREQKGKSNVKNKKASPANKNLCEGTSNGDESITVSS